MRKVTYPLWEKDRVTLQIAPNHFFAIELRENACVLSVTETTRQKNQLITYRIYVDEAMMQPEHFRMVVEAFLKDSVKKGILYERFLETDIIDQGVTFKTALEQQKMQRNSVGRLHCGSVINHLRHYHMEGPYSYECEGWEL